MELIEKLNHVYEKYKHIMVDVDSSVVLDAINEMQNQQGFIEKAFEAHPNLDLDIN